MAGPQLSSNSEEAFVLASVHEFVKAWAFGHQAQLNMECRNGRAWLKLGFQLGHPAAPHHNFPQPHQHRQYQRRHKGPARRERDRVRAEKFHAARQNKSAAASSEYQDVNPPPPPPQPEADLQLLCHPQQDKSLDRPVPLPKPAACPGPEPQQQDVAPAAAVPAAPQQPPQAAQAERVQDGHSVSIGQSSCSGLDDEFCSDEDYFTYLVELQRRKESEIRKLSKATTSLGFKPKHAKPPF